MTIKKNNYLKVNYREIAFDKIGKENFQRKLNENNLKTIKKNYNKNLVNALTLIDVRPEAKELGFEFSNVDGGHTENIVKGKGYKGMTAKIIPYEPKPVRAKYYTALNIYKKKLSASERFIGQLAYFDQESLAIKEICDGLKIGIKDITDDLYPVSCGVYQLEINYRKGVLEETLQTIKDVWGDNDYPYHNRVLQALRGFFVNYPDQIDKDHLVNSLIGKDPHKIVGEIENKRSSDGSGLTVIRDYYNVNAPSQKKLAKLKVVKSI